MDRRALVFLTNQSRVNYKLLSNLASQQSPPKDVNALTLDEIVEYVSSDAAVRPPTVKTVKLGDTVGLTASVTVRKSE